MECRLKYDIVLTKNETYYVETRFFNKSKDRINNKWFIKH